MMLTVVFSHWSLLATPDSQAFRVGRTSEFTGQHVLIQLDHLLGANVRGCPLFINNGALGIHDTISRYGRMGRGTFEAEAIGELAVDGAWEVDSSGSTISIETSSCLTKIIGGSFTDPSQVFGK